MQQTGLFAGIPVPRGDNREKNAKVAQKASGPKKPAPVSVRTTGTATTSMMKKIEIAVQTARQHLIDDGTTKLVQTEEEYLAYVQKCVEVGLASYDTETTGLDTIDDKIVGFSLYYDNATYAIYIPIAHTDYIGNPLPNQMPINVVAEGLRIIANSSIKLVYHNAKFDMKISNNHVGVSLPVGWDTSLAGNFLNEIEPHKLKPLWNKYVNKGAKPDSMTYDELFDGIPFNFVPLDIAHVYAGGDPKKTLELYKWQWQYLNPSSQMCKRKELVEAANLYINVEIPLIPYIKEMEDTGVAIDVDIAKSLHDRYHAEMETVSGKLNQMIGKLDLQRLPMNKLNKLSNPVNLDSPTQLAILIYDVMGFPQISGRSTDKAVLNELKHDETHGEFFTTLLEHRTLSKMLSTYIDKMPRIAKKGRVHGQFNQYGAKTGRFSSSDPNLQNIPSKRKEIRHMFSATDGYYLISGDFSQQEPRVLAHLCLMLFGDDSMIKAYASGLDLYSWMASMVYNVEYNLCKEKHPDGSSNPEGKKRRDSMKSVVLGVMYSRGSQAVADQLGWTKQRAQQVIDEFFNRFPAIKKVIDYYQNMAKEKGYVQTVYGRKRRLPDIQLPEFEIWEKTEKGQPAKRAPKEVETYFLERFKKARYKDDKEAIKRDASKRGFRVVDNGWKIAAAERECLNSVIQGTSADISKLAMLHVGRSEELRKLGYRMLICVHDEILGESPKENIKQVCELVTKLMVEACADVIKCPMRVDIAVSERWADKEIEIEVA